MTTVNETFTEINKQQNTLNIILQLIARTDPQQFYVTNTNMDYDTVRINAIISYLEVEKAAVEAIISDLLNCNVSGC